MHNDAYPNTEDALRLFLKNAVDHIDEAETLMGVPKGTYKPMKDAARALLDAFDKRDNARKALTTTETELTTQSKLTSTTVRASIQQIKKTIGIPAKVLDLLELNTPDTDPQARADAQVPTLKTKMTGIHPTIDGTKHGYDAIEIWSRRGSETEFGHFVTVTHFPFFDNRDNLDPTQPEEREYYGYYQKKNVVVSAQGPTVALNAPKGSHK